MEWIERLNRSAGRVAVGESAAEVLYWGYARHLPDNAPHRHTYFEVCLVGARGRGCFLVEGRPHKLKPGDLFIARPGVVHQIVSTAKPEMELYWVSYSWAAKDVAKGETGSLLRAFAESDVLVVADEEGRIVALWQALRAVAGGVPRPGYEPQVAGLTASLLLAIAQAAAGNLAPPGIEPNRSDARTALARQAVRYIHDNLNRRLPLAEIADYAHVSTRHLARLLVDFTGVSPALYIEHARIDRACGLLVHSSISIKEIAAEVGYPDVHHFTRVFSRHIGLPPGEFRQRGGSPLVRKIQSPGELI